jgi:hypothetical protein
MPVVLGTSEALLVSAEDGLVSMVPGMEGVYGACDVFITAGVGGAKMQFHMAVLSPMGGGQQKSRRAAASAKRAPRSHRMLNQW